MTKGKIKGYILGIIALFLYAPLTLANSVEGIVGTSGSKFNFRVIIKETSGSKSHTLCPGKVSDQIKSYKRMLARVKGANQSNCLQPQTFTLLKTAGGTEPIIGTLTKNQEQFSIKHKNKTYLLEKVPKRVKALEGKKLVLELAKSLKKNSNQYNVLFYAPAP